VRKGCRSKRFPLHVTTPLFEACASGDLGVAKWLWARGAGADTRLLDRYSTCA